MFAGSLQTLRAVELTLHPVHKGPQEGVLQTSRSPLGLQTYSKTHNSLPNGRDIAELLMNKSNNYFIITLFVSCKLKNNNRPRHNTDYLDCRG